MMGLLFLALVLGVLAWALVDWVKVCRERGEDCQWCDGTGDEAGTDPRFVCEACEGTGLTRKP